jgi:hypothetical protein
VRQSRNLGVDAIPRLGRLQEIRWDVFRQLVLLSPLSELLEVAALVLGIEVDEWLGMVGVYPELTEDANIHGAHELLPYDIEAVCDMPFDDELVVFERALAQVSVMFVIIIVCLAKEVQTVKMVKTLNVDRISATIFFVYFDEVLGHAYVASLLGSDAYRPKFSPDRCPCSIGLWTGILSESVLLEEGSVEALLVVADFIQQRSWTGQLLSSQLA